MRELEVKILYGGQFHFGYKPVKSGIIVLLLVIEYRFGFGRNLLVKANCVEHRGNVVFSQVSVGNAESDSISKHKSFKCYFSR